MSYKELHVTVLEDELDGHPLFKVDGVGAGISEFVHALRAELPSAVRQWPNLANVKNDPLFLMKYCLDWIVSIDQLNLFDWKIVYTNPDGGFLQLSYCRPGFVERNNNLCPDHATGQRLTRLERVLADDLM
jgi:hypothetical protein